MNALDTIKFIRYVFSTKKMKTLELPEFLNVFEELSGHKLSLFGHDTAVDFLKSIPETVQVNSEDEKFYLEVVNKIPSVWKRCESSDSENEDDDEDLFLASLSISSDESDFGGIDAWESKKLKGEKNMKRRSSDCAKDKYGVDDLLVEALYASDEEKEGQEGEKGSGEAGNRQGASRCRRCALTRTEKTNEECLDKCLASVVLDERNIPVINLPVHVKVGDDIGVYVPEVSHPHKFILHLKKFHDQLTLLMARMQAFYNLYNPMYAVNNFKFVENEICAVEYSTNPTCIEWYRGKIKSIGSQTTTVLLIDYGITTEVTNRDLRFLDRIFGNLPAQAINGRLANVKPFTENYWSEEGCKRFHEHVFEKDLAADVITVDSETQTLGVVLSSADRRFCLNDALIQELFAEDDFDLDEGEPAPPILYESKYSDGFICPEDVGKIRSTRSEFLDPKKPREERNEKLDQEQNNGEVGKPLGTVESAELSSLDLKVDSVRDCNLEECSEYEDDEEVEDGNEKGDREKAPHSDNDSEIAKEFTLSGYYSNEVADFENYSFYATDSENCSEEATDSENASYEDSYSYSYSEEDYGDEKGEEDKEEREKEEREPDDEEEKFDVGNGNEDEDTYSLGFLFG